MVSARFEIGCKVGEIDSHIRVVRVYNYKFE